MSKATICIHCGKAIEHPDNPEDVKEIRKIILKHDLNCPKNPLVAEVELLRRLLIYRDGGEHDIDCSINRGYEGRACNCGHAEVEHYLQGLDKVETK